MLCRCFGVHATQSYHTMLQTHKPSATHSGHQGPRCRRRHCGWRLRWLRALGPLQQGQRQHVAVGGLDPLVVVPDDAAILKGELFVEGEGVRVARLHMQVNLGDRCGCGAVLVVGVLSLLRWGRCGGGCVDAPRRRQNRLEEPGACVRGKWLCGRILRNVCHRRDKEFEINIRTDAPSPVGGLHAERHDVEPLLPVVHVMHAWELGVGCWLYSRE